MKDDLDPALGIILACVVGAAIWGLIALAVFL